MYTLFSSEGTFGSTRSIEFTFFLHVTNWLVNFSFLLCWLGWSHPRYKGGLICDPTWKEYVLQTRVARPTGTQPRLQRLYCQMQRGDVRIVDMLSHDGLYTWNWLSVCLSAAFSGLTPGVGWAVRRPVKWMTAQGNNNFAAHLIFGHIFFNRLFRAFLWFSLFSFFFKKALK